MPLPTGRHSGVCVPAMASQAVYHKGFAGAGATFIGPKPTFRS